MKKREDLIPLPVTEDMIKNKRNGLWSFLFNFADGCLCGTTIVAYSLPLTTDEGYKMSKLLLLFVVAVVVLVAGGVSYFFFKLCSFPCFFFCFFFNFSILLTIFSIIVVVVVIAVVDFLR